MAEQMLDPVFGYREKIRVTMMPGMAAGVVGGRRQKAVGQAHPPFRLPFQTNAVARSAMRCVKDLAIGNQICIAWPLSPLSGR